MSGNVDCERVVRVLLAESVRMVRDAFAVLLSLEADLEIVAEVERGDDVVAAAMRTKPDVVVLDTALGGLDCLSVVELLHQRLPGCRTLVVSERAQPGHVRRALRADVRGLVLKRSSVEQLIVGVRRVAAGDRVLDPELVTAVLDAGESPVSQRELDVLGAAGQGLRTEDIAAALSLSVGTVRNYLSNAISKLCARNRIDAIRIAREAGWL